MIKVTASGAVRVGLQGSGELTTVACDPINGADSPGAHQPAVMPHFVSVLMCRSACSHRHGGPGDMGEQ